MLWDRCASGAAHGVSAPSRYTGHVTQEIREFGTTLSALLLLLEWLVAQHCPVVAMESTGVYWKPVYHVLVGTARS